MPAEDRKQRAESRKARATITRSTLADADVDRDPVYGLEAMSLAWRLTREAWSLSGQPWPDYDRASTPYRFTLKTD